MLRRILVPLLLCLCCAVGLAETRQLDSADAGGCMVSVSVEEVGDELLQITILPMPQEGDRVLPEAFMLYECGEAMGVAYPSEEGEGWLGFAPFADDTLILVPVVDAAENPAGVIFLPLV